MRQFLNRQLLPTETGLLLALILFVLLLIAAAIGFSLLEGWSLWESLYMAIITVSTVGFAEVHPLSQAGQIFASFVILSALLLAVYSSTRIGQFILEGELFGVIARRRMQRALDHLNRHYIVCGYGRVGKPVALGLLKAGQKLCVLDASGAVQEELKSSGIPHLTGDCTEEDLLKDAGIERATCLMALLPSDADNLYLTITAKSMNPRIRVIARALDHKAGLKLKRGGADRVVSVYEMVGNRVLQAALKPTVVEFIELASLPEEMDLALEELVIGEGSRLVNLTLAEAGIRSRLGLIVVATKKEGGRLMFNPGPEQRLGLDDTLVVLGPRESLDRLVEECRGKG